MFAAGDVIELPVVCTCVLGGHTWRGHVVEYYGGSRPTVGGPDPLFWTRLEDECPRFFPMGGRTTETGYEVLVDLRDARLVSAVDLLGELS